MNNLAIGIGGLIVVAAVSFEIQEPFPIRTEVNLVQLHVTVTDSAGNAIGGLAKSAFRLLVDDVPQEITVFQGEDAPVTAGIVVDNSASMASKRPEVIAGALAFARASNPKDQIFVVHFSTSFRFGLPQGTRFTDNISELESAIASFELGGTTAFYDALIGAESQFQYAAYRRKVLLTITDGGDNSSRMTLADAVTGARDSGIVIYPIGVFDQDDRDRNPAVLEKLAEQTGGRASFPQQISGIKETCVQIAQEIREQYTLGFPGASDGKYHRISLSVSDPKHGPLKAETRAGYLADPGPRGGAQK